MSAIITFARNRIAYIVLKSLAEKGIKVVTCDSVYPAMAFFSKYSKNYFIHPSFTQDPNSFIHTMLSRVKTMKPKVLMPSHDETLLISYFKDKFERYTKVPIASYQKMNIARDKTKMAKIANELSIPVPKTYSIKNLDELLHISELLDYPAVIKIPRGRGAWGLTYVHTKSELIKSYKKTIQNFGYNSGAPFVQEYIPGDGYGVSMLFNQGEPRALFTHKRLMEYPITGGASVDRISVKNPQMEEYARDLLSHLGWHGVAMVEFKFDRRTRKPYFLEINPRFWGSLNQAVCSGVDFPSLLYEMAVNGDVSPVFNYKVGVRTIWVLGQLQTILNATKNGYGTKALKRLKSLANNAYYDDFSVTDIVPFMIEPVPYFIQFIHKGSLDIYESIDDALDSIIRNRIQIS